MPQFQLNTDGAHGRWSRLSEFEQGYVEALFFTNGDSGDDDADKLNRLGLRRVSASAWAFIANDCRRFVERASPWLQLATAGNKGFDMTQAGRDFWFTRNRHGVGFTDREGLPDALAEKLKIVAHGMGEVSHHAYKGWIYND